MLFLAIYLKALSTELEAMTTNAHIERIEALSTEGRSYVYYYYY